MTSTLIGANAKPAVLILGEVPEIVATTVEELATTTRRVSSLFGIRQSEWDAVVTFHAPLRSNYLASADEAESHLNVLLFVSGGDESDTIEQWQGLDASRTYRHLSIIKGSTTVRCNEFVRPTGDAEVVALVSERLLPAVRRRRDYWFLVCSQGVENWNPLLIDAEGRALAATYGRGMGGGEAVLVPSDATALDQWVRWSFERWRRSHPRRFAGVRDWSRNPRWMTAEEASALQALENLEEKRQAAIQEFDRIRLDLEGTLTNAHESARAGVRRLLTGSGSELVDAVVEALTAMGFDVSQSDDKESTKGALLEDLLITDKADPEWKCLAEVKGLTGGARVTDLQVIARWALNFAVAQGKPPSSRWYIVNQFRHQSADSRPEPLESHSAEVRSFAEQDDGSIIDTRCLFRLARSAAAMTDHEKLHLRANLRAQRGVWQVES